MTSTHYTADSSETASSTVDWASIKDIPPPPNVLPGVYEIESIDPTIAITGAGNRNLSVRELVWGTGQSTDVSDGRAAAASTSVRQRAQAALAARMGLSAPPSARDLNLLDFHLELAIKAVGGHRGVARAEPTYYNVENEVDRYSMPHYVMDDTVRDGPVIKELYGVSESYKFKSYPANKMSDDHFALAVKIAVERTLPFTAVSRVDDEIFRKEDWRRHTMVDVVTASSDAAPQFVPPIPSKPHAKLSGLVDNVRYDQVSEQPLYPDGHPAWFRGWDQFFQADFPEEMA